MLSESQLDDMKEDQEKYTSWMKIIDTLKKDIQELIGQKRQTMNIKDNIQKNKVR